MFDPNAGITQVPFETEIVKFVDSIVDMTRRNGSKRYVDSQGDWTILEYIYNGFKIFYPEDAYQFEQYMHSVHQATNWNNGISHEGDAIIEHILEVPQKLYQMIGAIYPDQKWTGSFARKFKGHFPQMAGHLSSNQKGKYV